MNTYRSIVESTNQILKLLFTLLLLAVLFFSLSSCGAAANTSNAARGQAQTAGEAEPGTAEGAIAGAASAANQSASLSPAELEGSETAGAQSSQVQTSLAKRAWVSAKEGLRVREGANTTAKVLTVLPYRAQVVVHNEKPETIEIAGTKGKWTEVEWESYRGWAFGGYLTFDPATVLASESTANLAKGSLAWSASKDGVWYVLAIDFDEPEWKVEKSGTTPQTTAYIITKPGAQISIPLQGKGGPEGAQVSTRPFVPMSAIPFELVRTEVKVGRGTWAIMYTSPKYEVSLSLEASTPEGLTTQDIALFDRAVRTLRMINE